VKDAEARAPGGSSLAGRLAIGIAVIGCIALAGAAAAIAQTNPCAAKNPCAAEQHAASSRPSQKDSALAEVRDQLNEIQAP
jgi:hypothetical protein